MKVIVIVNQKGGVGKTAIAAALATERAKTHPITMIDLDPQASLTGWSFGMLPATEISQSYRKLSRVNTMTFLRGQTSFESSQIKLSDNLNIIGANTELTNFRNEFEDYAGKELILKSLLEEVREDKNVTQCDILIDTPGDLSLNSILGLASANTCVIPVSTSIFGVDALGSTLQRIGQVQKMLNPNLRKITVVPSLHRKSRNSNKVTLQILSDGYGELLARDSADHPIIIEDRAEMERFLHSHEALPKGVLKKSIVELIRGLYE